MQFTNFTPTHYELPQKYDHIDNFQFFLQSFYSDIFGPNCNGSYERICACYMQQSTRTVCDDYLNMFDTVTGTIEIFKQITTSPSSMILPANISIKSADFIPTLTESQGQSILHLVVTGTTSCRFNEAQITFEDTLRTESIFTHVLVLSLEISSQAAHTSPRILTEVLHLHAPTSTHGQALPLHKSMDTSVKSATPICNSIFEPVCLLPHTPTTISTLTPLSSEYQLGIWSSMESSPQAGFCGSNSTSMFDDIFRLHSSWNSPSASPFAPAFDCVSLIDTSTDIQHHHSDRVATDMESMLDSSLLKCIEAIQNDNNIASPSTCDFSVMDESGTSVYSVPRSSPTSANSYSHTARSPPGLISPLATKIDTPIDTPNMLSHAPIADIHPPKMLSHTPVADIHTPKMLSDSDSVLCPCDMSPAYESVFESFLDLHETSHNRVCKDSRHNKAEKLTPAKKTFAQIHTANDIQVTYRPRKQPSPMSGRDIAKKTKQTYKQQREIQDENVNTSHDNNGPVSMKKCAAKHGPPLWGLLEGERDRMVYVSWVPRVARADEVSKKKKCEMQLRWFIVSYLGFTGLNKVLLYPPSSAHCKLLFDTEDTAKQFLTQFGGSIERSAGPQRWKEAICKYYKVDILDGIKGTKVKVIWADASKESIPKKEETLTI